VFRESALSAPMSLVTKPEMSVAYIIGFGPHLLTQFIARKQVTLLKEMMQC